MNRMQHWCLGLILIAVGVGCWRTISAPAPQKPGDVKPDDQPAPAAGKVDPKAPWPMFGGTPSRNMVNLTDKNVPVTWNVGDADKKIPAVNIKWNVEVGNHCYGGPVVADGKVFVGTNNHNLRDKKITGKKAILMAFAEADGQFLWQIVHEIPDDAAFDEGRSVGLCSTPTVEDRRLYYTTPGCEVVCADTDGKIIWTLDMYKDLKVVPFHLSNCAPLIVGDLVIVITGNGTDNQGKVVSPKAPSFLAVNKKTGKVAWQSTLPNQRIIEGQWSNPTLAVVNGKEQVIFAGGDTVIYALEPLTGKEIWKCDCIPKRKTPDDRGIDNYIIGTPVVAGNRLYVALGIAPDTGNISKFSYFLCLDVTKTGDVSIKSYDAKSPDNKNSALVWAVGGLIDPPPARGRQANFGSSISTPAVHDGLVYITEITGVLHCFDAANGKRHWEHDFKDVIWASPYVVDGKVYVGTLGGDVVIFQHGKECKYYVQGQVVPASRENEKKLPSASLDDNDTSTAVVANGVLYFATKSRLIAIANGK